jgi:hypothetical protein
MTIFLKPFDRLADEVRHPALTLDLFTTEPLEDSDEPADEPDDAVIGQALAPAALQTARRRRGALMFGANLVFDRILDDLVVSDAESERLGVERFADEHLPSQLRHRYDASFLRKLLATAAKVAQDLASDEYTYPACTAEELVLWAILQEWQVLLDLTALGRSWTTLSEYLFEDLDFEYCSTRTWTVSKTTRSRTRRAASTSVRSRTGSRRSTVARGSTRTRSSCTNAISPTCST